MAIRRFRYRFRYRFTGSGRKMSSQMAQYSDLCTATVAIQSNISIPINKDDHIKRVRQSLAAFVTDGNQLCGFRLDWKIRATSIRLPHAYRALDKISLLKLHGNLSDFSL